MKRHALKLVVFLLLGAVINVSVAWAICYFNTWNGASTQTCGNIPTASGECLTFILTSQRGAELAEWYASRDVARLGGSAVTLWPPDWCWVPSEAGFQGSGVAGHPQNSQWIESAAGWPLLSMRWCLEGRLANNSLKPRRLAIRLRDRSLTVSSASQLVVLPVDPAWPGFLINTLLYAAILWLPLFAFGFVRRRRRIKHGQCARCAYDLRSSGIEHQACPECGAQLSLPS